MKCFRNTTDQVTKLRFEIKPHVARIRIFCGPLRASRLIRTLAGQSVIENHINPGEGFFKFLLFVPHFNLRQKYSNIKSGEEFFFRMVLT